MTTPEQVKKKYERTPPSPFGKGTEYRQVKRYVPWCTDCDSEIRGNGSHIDPYTCECRTIRYHYATGEFRSYPLEDNE